MSHQKIKFNRQMSKILDIFVFTFGHDLTCACFHSYHCSMSVLSGCGYTPRAPFYEDSVASANSISQTDGRAKFFLSGRSHNCTGRQIIIIVIVVVSLLSNLSMQWWNMEGLSDHIPYFYLRLADTGENLSPFPFMKRHASLEARGTRDLFHFSLDFKKVRIYSLCKR